MLEIVRDRTWRQDHSFFDRPDVPTDFTGYTFKCQIRNAVAVKNASGIYEHALVATVTVSVTDNVVTWSLTRAQTAALSTTGKYQIDMVGTKDGVDHTFISPEPIRVTNRPSIP